MNKPINSTMTGPRYYVLMTEQYGRGVYAEQKLDKGASVMYCEILVLDQIDTKKVNDTQLKWYTFTFDADKEQDCLVLGDGEIFNHSDTPNVRYYLQNINGRFMMVFRTTKAIDKDEQLFIDYNADVKESVDVMKEYTTNLVG